MEYVASLHPAAQVAFIVMGGFVSIAFIYFVIAQR